MFKKMTRQQRELYTALRAAFNASDDFGPLLEAVAESLHGDKN
jgi:hypothetical protein